MAPSLQTFNIQVYVLLHVERSTHLSPLAQGAALVLGRNVKSFHCQTLIASIHLCARFQIRIYPPISSAESVLCAFCLNPVNFSTQPQNTQLQIIFVSPSVSLSHICCRNQPLSCCSEARAGIRQKKKHTRLDSAAELALKILRKVQSKLFPVVG